MALDTDNNIGTNEQLEIPAVCRKQLRTSKLLRLINANQAPPKLNANSVIDLNEKNHNEENTGNKLDSWFENKIMPLKPKNRTEKRIHHHGPKAAHEIKRELEEVLSKRRKKELQQRIQFYNADNENFSDTENKEEDIELSDDEDLSDNDEKVDLSMDDEQSIVNIEDIGAIKNDDEEAESKELNTEIECGQVDEACDDDDESLDANKDGSYSISDNKTDEFGDKSNLNDDNLEQGFFNLKSKLSDPLDLGNTQEDPLLNLHSDANMDDLVALCSGNFGSYDTETRDILASPSSQSAADLSLESMTKKNSLSNAFVVLDTQDLSDRPEFNISQQINIADYFDDDLLEDHERVDDDDEKETMSRKRPINSIESDDEEPVASAPPKRRLKFEDSDDEESDCSQVHSQAVDDPLQPSNADFESRGQMAIESIPLELDDELFTADYEDDGPAIDTDYYGDELEDDGGYKERYVAQISDDDLFDKGYEDGGNIKIQNVFDDEASLSGDDVGSDSDNEDEEKFNEYEAEEGDADILPDEEELRDGIIRQYMKQTHDEEDRRLLQIQETLFADGDLHGDANIDRSFRYRWRGGANDLDIDWTKLTGDNTNMLQDLENEEAEDPELKKHQAEMARWKMNMEKESQKTSLFDDEMNDSPLFEASKKVVINKKPSTVSIAEKSSLPRDSLLNKAASLNVLLKEVPTNEARTNVAFRAKAV